MSRLPRRQRVAAYAVILRQEQILLCRLAPRVSRDELWTLPGGGLDHGEDPRHAVLREIHEETGLSAKVGETARVYSAHMPAAWREGRQVDAHALRIVYDGWVPLDSPEPRVLERDGSTVEAAWIPISDVVSGVRPVVGLVADALADYRPFRMQRVASYAVVTREDPEPAVLLTRISPNGAHPGRWTLPGGGVDHGESPAAALVREVREECGVDCQVGPLLDVHDLHFSGTAPSGRFEDYHGVHLIFEVRLDPTAQLRVAEAAGTTDEVAWVPLAEVEAGRIPVHDVVHHALAKTPR